MDDSIGREAQLHETIWAVRLELQQAKPKFPQEQLTCSYDSTSQD